MPSSHSAMDGEAWQQGLGDRLMSTGVWEKSAKAKPHTAGQEKMALHSL